MTKKRFWYGLSGLIIIMVAGAYAFDAWWQPIPKLNTNPTTYKLPEVGPVLIRNVTVLDGLGGQRDGIDLILQGGKIEAIGNGLATPADARVIENSGYYVTPGLIDLHTHLGTASLPYFTGDVDGWDVNEATEALTPPVRAEHAIWPQDPSFTAALAGGVTTFQVLPGSSNLIGGLGVVLKNVPSATAQGMKFPDAKYGLKMACGENPKGYGQEGKSPGSRMGNVALQRQAWVDAKAYDADYQAGRAPRDLGMETLAAALRGDVKVHVHCYRADDMATMMDMANEFGFQIAAFHHAVEAYKIPALLKENDICSAVWSDWWGFKMEALDGIQENAAFLDAAEACAIIHSDAAVVGQMLMVEAAKALAAGRRAGLTITKAEALRWLTINPAKALGLDDRIGSLEVGKNADVVVWSGDPFSIYSKAEHVFLDGAEIYDRSQPTGERRSDFMLGQPVVGESK